MLVKLIFRELCDSNLSGLGAFDNMAISLGEKQLKIRKEMCMSSQDANP